MTGRCVAARRLALSVLGVCLTAAALSAQAPTAASLYERAVDREATLRAKASPGAQDFRAAVAAYETVVRKFPKSGYCDNALWQAAGVALAAYERSHADVDRATGDRLLTWLSGQYPASPLAKDVAARRTRFASTPAPSVNPASPLSTSSAQAPSTNSGQAAQLRSISREPLPNGDRLVLDIDREVAFSGDRIANPDRVFLDLTGTSVGPGVNVAVSALQGGLIKGVRLGQPSPGTTRVVIELTGTATHSVYPLYGPYRLVIDAEGPRPPALTKTEVSEPPALVSEPTASAPAPRAPASEETAAAPAPTSVLVSLPAPPARVRGGEYSLARQLGLGVSRIVIDAGHGGHDPGAQANGIDEKHLVLDIALKLQTLLQTQPGVEVLLTRAIDEFIPLEERTAIANRAGADLFLSIHANASPRSATRGLETYFLNFASNPQAEALAARENATSSRGMSRLPELVRAIALNNKLAESRDLATMVQTSMVRKLKGHNAAVKDLGVKQAPFVVLIGAEMPSVLAEISFITNRAEASLLKQQKYRDRIAQSLFDAIVKYQSSLKKITTVAARGSKR